MKNINLNLKNLFMHALDSITRAHVNREGFDANWSDLAQKPCEKDWKNNGRKSNLQFIIARDFCWNCWPNCFLTSTTTQP